MTDVRKNNITLRQIWHLVTSGDLNIDLREKNDANTSKVLIQSDRVPFSVPFYPS